MIYFNTGHTTPLNYIIHNFLRIEVFSTDTGLENIIIKTVPTYLKREQYHKCEQVYKQLYQWTEDEIPYSPTVFHEFLLYKFLEYMSYLQKHKKGFNKNYFDEKGHRLIEEVSKWEYEDSDEKELSLDDYKDIYYDIDSYEEYLFIDSDFSFLDILYNETSVGRKGLLKRIGTNIDQFFELLPLSIQKQYETSHITLSGDIIEMLQFLQNKIDCGNLSKLFWNNKEPIDLENVQQILDNIITSYYYNQNIELFWDSKINSDTLNFLFYKRREEEKKFLVSIRRPAEFYLKKGYEEKLLKKSEIYEHSYFILLCYTDEEYNSAEKFIRENVYTDTYKLYLNIAIFDVRRKEAPSKMK